MSEKTNLPQQQGTQTTSISTSVNFFDPAQFETAQRMSKLFAASMLVPDTYQVDKIANDLVTKKHMDPNAAQQQAQMTAVANCMIAIDIATRIGASPLMVMQNLVIIYGRPSWSSKFLIATVNSCGRFEPLKFRFTEKGNLGKFDYFEYEKTWVAGQNGGRGYYKTDAVKKTFDGTNVPNLECVAYTTAKGSKDVLESSPISMRMAVDEGWYAKNGSKWRTMPRQMLMYRAASFWTSAYAPELSMGMRTVEETQDIIDITDAAEEVDTEKAQFANKEEVSFDAQPAPSAKAKDQQSRPQGSVGSDSAAAKGQAPAGVDPETGEIKDAAADGPDY